MGSKRVSNSVQVITNQGMGLDKYDFIDSVEIEAGVLILRKGDFIVVAYPPGSWFKFERPLE